MKEFKQMSVEEIEITISDLEKSLIERQKEERPINVLNRSQRRTMSRLGLSDEFERISQNIKSMCNFIISPNNVKIGFMTVYYLIENFKNVDINDDYQRHMIMLNGFVEDKWDFKSKISYIESLLNGSAQTNFVIVDYRSCKTFYPELSDYFGSLIEKGHNYGLLDGGHRYLLLIELLKGIQDGKEDKLLLELCRRLGKNLSELIEEIEKSIIYFQINMRLTREEIHNLFSMLNCGVSVSKTGLINGLISDLNDHIHKLKNDSVIQNILQNVSKKEKTYNFDTLYTTYFLESHDREVKSFTNVELEDFVVSEDSFITDVINKHYYLFCEIETILKDYYVTYNNSSRISTSQLIGLYQLLSIIYDNKKSIDPTKYGLFMKIYLGWFKERNNTLKLNTQSNKKDDTWFHRFRDINKHFDKKWELFTNLYKDRGAFNFENTSDNKLTFQSFLIDNQSIVLVTSPKLQKVEISLTKKDRQCLELMKSHTTEEIGKEMGVSKQMVDIRKRKIKKWKEQEKIKKLKSKKVETE